jgi:hypothetical protein
VLPAGDFARVVRRWSVAADPAGADGTYREEADRERVVLARTLEGWHLQGWLSATSGAALDAALTARTGIPAADDTRSPAQRRANALTSLARMVLDAGTLTPGAAVRPHLQVHVPYDTLTRLAAATDPALSPVNRRCPGLRADSRAADRLHQEDTPAVACDQRPSRRALNPELEPPDLLIPGMPDPATMTGAVAAELDDGTVLPHGLLSRLACDSSLARVVFGPDSEVLDSGRTKRLFTPGQRRAIIARDRHCRFPGCSAPPTEGEIHHSIWWFAHGGTTRTDDGLLLCWYHHDYVHHRNITIARHPAARGPGWTFWRPDGREIVAALPRPASARRADTEPAC